MTRAGRHTLLANWLVPLGLFVLAAAIRLVVAAQLPFPATEPSAYYVNVAENIVAGNGFVSDSIWSYASGPLVVPKPAFELWLPLSSLISAGAMMVLGSTFWAAQVGGALVGAAVAPLAWAIAREAAHTQALDRRRSRAVAISAGLLAAVLAPLVLGSAVPDSYTPYVVFVLLSALLIPRVLGVRDGADTELPTPPTTIGGLLLGSSMGLAYLSRQEIIWLGLTVILMLWWVIRAHQPGRRSREALSRLWPIVVGGLVIVVPWLMRNASDFGSPFPGQAIENLFLRRNEEIFAFLDRPESQDYLSQGLLTVLGNPIAAAWDALFNVLAVPAFPIGIVGLAALIAMRHAPSLRRPTALVALLISGGLTFLTTVLLFPVATLWGTFLHASGPLMVALIVVAVLGGDALLARVSRIRNWDQTNVVLAPVALLSVAVLLSFFQVLIFSGQSEVAASRYAAVANAIEDAATESGTSVPDTIITDHPMFLADALGRTAIALPDEDLSSILALSRTFDAPWVVVIDERGRYPTALLEDADRTCQAQEPRRIAADPSDSWLFILDQTCVSQ